MKSPLKSNDKIATFTRKSIIGTQSTNPMLYNIVIRDAETFKNVIQRCRDIWSTMKQINYRKHSMFDDAFITRLFQEQNKNIRDFLEVDTA